MWSLQVESPIWDLLYSFSKEIKWVLLQTCVNENFAPKSNLGLILINIFKKVRKIINVLCLFNFKFIKHVA
jgi:hypothetical protein